VKIATATAKLMSESASVQTLMIVNHIRGLVGQKGLELKDLYGTPKAKTSPEELAEILDRFSQIPLTTDEQQQP